MTLYPFGLLMVTTHALHLMSLIKPPSLLKVTHLSFRHASPHLCNQLPTSLGIPHPNYSSPSQRPSFKHAGLTCYTLLSPSITFSLFHSELSKLPFQKSLSSTLVCFCLSDWPHGSRLFTGLLCSSVLCFSSIFLFLLFLSAAALWSTFSHTINSLIDWLIDWLID